MASFAQHLTGCHWQDPRLCGAKIRHARSLTFFVFSQPVSTGKIVTGKPAVGRNTDCISPANITASHRAHPVLVIHRKIRNHTSDITRKHRNITLHITANIGVLPTWPFPSSPVGPTEFQPFPTQTPLPSASDTPRVQIKPCHDHVFPDIPLRVLSQRSQTSPFQTLAFAAVSVGNPQVPLPPLLHTMLAAQRAGANPAAALHTA